MKVKKIWNSCIRWVFVFLLIVTVLPVSSVHAGVTYTKVTQEAQLKTGKYIMVVDSGYAPTYLESGWIGAEQPIIHSEEIVDPDATMVWQLEVDPIQKLVSLKDSKGNVIKPLGGNNNGVSTGEYLWKYVFTEGTFTIAGQNEDVVLLASNKSSQHKFRGYKTTTVLGSPNGYPSNFTLYQYKEGDVSSVEAPIASPKTGEVESGTTISLSSFTKNAKIYYTLDGTLPTNASLDYDIEKPVIIKDCTLKAVAYLNGIYSPVQTNKYTIQQKKPVINDGDTVVIYAPAYQKALSSVYNGFYNTGVDVTFNKEELVGFGANEVWQVSNNANGTYSFSFNHQKLAMADNFSSLTLGEVHDEWELIPNTNDTYYLKNKARGAYIEWYASKSNWSGYNTIASGSEALFELQFYVTKQIENKKLTIEPSPANQASVKQGQMITLHGEEGVELYFTMSTDGTVPVDPTRIESLKYTTPIEVGKTPEKEKPIIIRAMAYDPVTQKTGDIYTFTYQAFVDIDDYQLYFGQLHSHTNLSDGTGTVEQAFQYASQVKNLDFLAVTDHSNWFEGRTGLPEAGTTHLKDANAKQVNAAWRQGHNAADAITKKENGTFVGIYGYEMTWSGGLPGHINTYNSKGFENRNVAPYKGDNVKVLDAYYNALNENPETISQFNHPGDTFGDFMDFALYNPITDHQMTLIEVGNGEGKIGGSGYFPSYAYYTRALDKGWHLAPTNNQDNHKGAWGDANTARSVVLAKELSREAIYDAMKNYRVYASEDNDLSIYYTLNQAVMGSILETQPTIEIQAKIKDPTDIQGSTKVEVIVNGGQVLDSLTFTGGTKDVTFSNLSNKYSYYYLRVTQEDKNVAVTAPVWVGESINAGVSSTQSNIALPITGDTIQITSQLFNNSTMDMKLTSLTYTLEKDTKPFHIADVAKINGTGIVSGETLTHYAFDYTVSQAGIYNLNVELKGMMDGKEYTFTDVLKLHVMDASVATKVLIDGSHYNDYVTGYYANNISNFVKLGMDQNIQVQVVEPGTVVTDERLKDVSLFVISAPLRYTSQNTGNAKVSVFEDEFVTVVKRFVENGGTVVATGLADYQDSNTGVPYTSYTQVNKLLEGIGSSMMIHDDELLDQDDNGGQPYRLYFDDYQLTTTNAFALQLLDGVKESGLKYSSYSGCSVDEGKGIPLVFGHDTTYSINSKNPAQGHRIPVTSFSTPYDPQNAVMKKGEVVALAYEPVSKGNVIVAGTVFLSNFEVSKEDETIGYSNHLIATQLLQAVRKKGVISTIQEARAGKIGDTFTVQGIVANGTFESGNAFFDTIYIQDDKGNGINVFPVNDATIKRGMKIQITGTMSEYLGDKQLNAISITGLDGMDEIVVTDLTTKQANDYLTNFGRLVKVQGTVQRVHLDDAGMIDEIVVQDESDEAVRLFIDGYISYSNMDVEKLETFVKVGSVIEGMGFVSHDPEGNRLRVRDRAEIKEIKRIMYEVKTNLVNGTMNGALTAVENQDYKATLVPIEHYVLPKTIMITIAGQTLDLDSYQYDEKMGTIVILKEAVKGMIEISATFVKAEIDAEVPNTGDSSSALPWILLAIGGLAGVGWFYYKKKKKE